MIDKYLDKGDMFVLEDDGVKVEYVVTKEEEWIYELENIAVAPKSQLQSYGKKLLEYVFNYFSNCKKMLVGTGDVPSSLGFYHKCSFSDSHCVKKFYYR